MVFEINSAQVISTGEMLPMLQKRRRKKYEDTTHVLFLEDILE